MSDDDDGHGDEEQQQDEIEQRASQSPRRLTAVAAH
ncbi:ATP-binding cassette transporter [Aspergillus luchuensis]|uniref:ATP-binding cassette transporter n=1 Tax=Aspergillus kawachii TaxID=1069201 RepID=A0A146FM96_ASPKA|nr:ATP-binding cassette transporter [Aspergillus luchuensis]